MLRIRGCCSCTLVHLVESHPQFLVSGVVDDSEGDVVPSTEAVGGRTSPLTIGRWGGWNSSLQGPSGA